MRNLIHFRIQPNGRITITEAPPVGAETIFSENYLRERCMVEEPGVVTRPETWPLPIGTIITVDPTQGATMTFRVDRHGPYDPPDYLNEVYFTTRLT